MIDKDPDLGLFLPLDPGSGSGVKFPDYFSESLETVLGLNILQFFGADPDPGSGIFLTPDPGWKNWDPG
jgi:hypothetical protein